MRKLIAGAAVAAIVSGVAGTAFAGEVTGGPNPKPTPISTYNANSICSFSGQNDDPTGTNPETGEIDPAEAGRVQNWGHVKNFIKNQSGGPGASQIVGLMHEFGPGVSCNGHSGELAGG